MKNQTIKKINTFGKIGYIICKIGKIALMIATIACLVGAFLTCFIPKEAVKIELTTSNTAVIKFDDRYDLPKILDLDIEDFILEIGENTYKVIDSQTDGSAEVTTVFYVSNLKWVLFAAALSLFAVVVVFYFAEKLCKSFKECETPFTKEVSDILTKLAYSLVGMGVVSLVVASVVNSVLSNGFVFTVDVNFITVLLILCVFTLSYIFKHGVALQTESDELL